MLPLGAFTPSNFLAPANPLTMFGVYKYFEYIKFINNSPQQLSINFGGQTVTLSEFRVKDIALPAWFQGTMVIIPTTVITSFGHAQSNLLVIEGYYKGEIITPEDAALPQQAVTTTATGKPRYSCTVGFGATATAVQSLNMFNPALSGVIGTIDSIRVYTNDGSSPTINLGLFFGADINEPLAVPTVSHDASSNPPNSVMHCTAADNGAFHAQGVFPEVYDVSANNTQDLMGTYDFIRIFPGANVTMDLSAAAANHIVRLTYKWTEDTIVAPQAITGAINVASSIINDGNPASTNVVEATAFGDSPSDVLIQNNGTGIFKGLLQALGNFVTNLIQNVSGNNLIINTLGVGDTIQLQSQGTKFLQVGAGGVGFKTSGAIKAGFQMIGDTTIANAGTTVNHALGVVPTTVLPVLDAGSAGSADVIKINYGTMTTTTFQAFSTNASGTGNVRFFVLG